MVRSQIQKAAFLAGLVALAAMLFAGAASAGTITIFSNLSGFPSFNLSYVNDVAGIHCGVGSFVAAMPFTAAATADLTGALLALQYLTGNQGPISVYLESNKSGLPSGTILATLAQQGTIISFPELVTFDYSGTAPVALTSGTSYWLVAQETGPDADYGWDWSNSDTGTIVYNDSGSATGPWDPVSNWAISAFQVSGTTLTPVAEPGSFRLFLLGILCAVGWIAAKRKRHLA